MATVKWGIRISAVYETHDVAEDGKYQRTDGGETDALEVFSEKLTEEDVCAYMYQLRDQMNEALGKPHEGIWCRQRPPQ